MYALLLASVLAFSQSLFAQTLELRPPNQLPLRPPASDVSLAIRKAHRAFVCWGDGVRTITPKYQGGKLQSVTLHIENDVCDIAGLDLVFNYVSNNELYTVLELASPAITDTPLAPYPDANLVLSVIDSFNRPMRNGLNESLFDFRMILEHAYQADPAQYGQVLMNYSSKDEWKQVKLEILSQRIEYRPGHGDPRFPDTEEEYTVTKYRRTSENSFTKKQVSSEFENWVRN